MQEKQKVNQKEECKETELCLLPENWNILGFNKCINKERIKVGNVKKQNYKKSGKFPIVDQGQNLIAGYWDVADDVYKGKLPVIIFGDHTRIVKYVEFPFVCGADGTKIILPNLNLIYPKFFYYALKNTDIPSRGYNRHYSILRKKKIVCPPIQEQKKIAGVLSAVQEAKEKTEEVIKSSKELKKSLMKHLFTYGPVSIEEAEKIKTKETEFGYQPTEWNQYNLGHIARVRGGYGFPHRYQGEKTGKYPFFKVSDMNTPGNEIFMTKANNYIEDDIIDKLKAKLFSKNTVIFPKVGAALHTNKKRILSSDSLIDNNVMGVTIVAPETCEPLFLLNFFHLINLSNLSNPGPLPSINGNTVKKLNLYIPPIQIQKKIVDILSSIEKKIEAEENKKKVLEELFKTLLNNLMTGKIRVHNLCIEI